MGKRSHDKAAELHLCDFALTFPETHEDFPWGHRVMKVKKKAFVFMGSDDGRFSVSVKLPESGQAALTLPFAEPTGYGLGKSGWVSARFPAGKEPPLSLLEKWVEESYRAVAPKTLVKQLDAGAGRSPAAPKRASPSKKKPATGRRTTSSRRRAG